MNILDAIWVTYAVAGRLPDAEQVRAPVEARPAVEGEGRGSASGGGGLKAAVALSRKVLRATAKLTRSLAEGLVRWHRRNAAMRELMRLDDRMLADIGLSRHEIGSVVDAMLKDRSSSRPRRTPRVETLPANENAPEIAANDNEPKVAA